MPSKLKAFFLFITHVLYPQIIKSKKYICNSKRLIHYGLVLVSTRYFYFSGT